MLPHLGPHLCCFMNKEIELEKGKSESEVTQSCPTLCDPMDCSLPGSSVRGILQARILEWVAISFSRRSSQPRDQTQVSHITGRCYRLSHQGSQRRETAGLNRQGSALAEKGYKIKALWL